jgi:hypothetical protein
MQRRKAFAMVGGAFLALVLATASRAQQTTTESVAGVLTPAMLGQTPPAETPAPEKKEPTFWETLTSKGYVQTSYTFNGNKPKAAGVENSMRVFDSTSNEFMLNAVELYVERPVSDQQLAGFVVDTLLGQNADVTQAFGLFNDGDADAENIDLVQALVQFYVPWSAGTVRVGKFVTSAGQEVIYAPDNEQISRSMLFGFAIPFTHTGLTYTQPFGEMFSVQAGIANGWDVVRDNNESKVILTSATLKPGGGFTIIPSFFYSFSEQAGDEENGRTLFDVYAVVQPFTKDVHGEELAALKIIGNFDIAGEEGAAANGGFASWWGFAVGLRYEFPLTDESRSWFIAARGEYFDDSDGARAGAAVPGITALGGTYTGADFWEMTFTLGYKPYQFLQLRSELRYDKSNEQVFLHRSDGDRAQQMTLAFDAMFMF